MNRKSVGALVIYGSVLLVAVSPAYSDDSTATTPLKVYVPNLASLPDMPSVFIADKMNYDASNFIVSVRGKVEIVVGENRLKADIVEYDQEKNVVIAKGNVEIVDADGIRTGDEFELADNMKGSIIRSFKAELAENQVFMTMENKKNVVLAETQKSLFDQFIENLVSDPHLDEVKTEVAANEFADLAPAAGGDVIPEKPVVGDVPLIVLPEENQTAPAEATKPVESVEKTEDKTEANVEEKAPEPAAVVPELPLAVENNIADLLNKDTLEKKMESDIDLKKIIAPIDMKDIHEAASKPADKEPTKEVKKEAKKEVKKDSKPKVKKDAKITTKPKDTNGEDTEDSLSPRSVDLLNKVVPKAMKEEQAESSIKPFKMDRSRDMQDLFKGNDAAPQSDESQIMGLKVENKSPRMNTDYELERAYNAINSGQSDVAIETYQAILEHSPNNTQALFGLATMYHRARQFDKARPLYSRLLTINPEHRDGFNNFLVLLADEAPREALRELEKLEEKNPGFSTIPAQVAVIYQKLGDNDKAIDKMLRAVSLAPENLVYRYNLAIMLDKQKKYDEAAKLYRQLLEAEARGEKIPGKADTIQQRLTFISSNR